MAHGFHIAPVRTPDDLAATAGLFAGYAAALPVKYAPPAVEA